MQLYWGLLINSPHVQTARDLDHVNMTLYVIIMKYRHGTDITGVVEMLCRCLQGNSSYLVRHCLQSIPQHQYPCMHSIISYPRLHAGFVDALSTLILLLLANACMHVNSIMSYNVILEDQN